MSCARVWWTAVRAQGLKRWSERGEMTRAAMIVSSQPLRLFHAKGCLLLYLHSPLVIPADCRILLIIFLLYNLKKIAGRHFFNNWSSTFLRACRQMK